MKEELAESQLREEERLKEIRELRQERTELTKDINNLKYTVCGSAQAITALTTIWAAPQSVR